MIVTNERREHNAADQYEGIAYSWWWKGILKNRKGCDSSRKILSIATTMTQQECIRQLA